MEGTPQQRRLMRLAAAPGLTRTGMKHLLRKWKRQARKCVYCAVLANCVDHVVPLILGGTNYEGNLVPCCRLCNSSKGTYLLIQWRQKREVREPCVS